MITLEKKKEIISRTLTHIDECLKIVSKLMISMPKTWIDIIDPYDPKLLKCTVSRLEFNVASKEFYEDIMKIMKKAIIDAANQSTGNKESSQSDPFNRIKDGSPIDGP